MKIFNKGSPVLLISLLIGTTASAQQIISTPIAIPVTVAKGGTACTAAAIACVDAITGGTHTGSTANVVTDTSPALVTPALGVATATSVAVGGGSIGSDKLEVNGSSTFNGGILMNSNNGIDLQSASNGVQRVVAVNGNGSQAIIVNATSSWPVQFGSADQAAPAASTITAPSVVAGTSNTAGTNWTIAGSRGTGTGLGGSLLFQTAPAGSTGTAQNALATALTIDSTKLATFAGAVSVGTNLQMNGVLLCSQTAPTISSGFGSSPSIVANNGTCAFEVNVGTGGSATSGVIGLPTAAHGWNCMATDITTNSTAVFLTKQTASATSSCTIGNFSDVAVATAWAASDKVRVIATAY